MGHALILIAEDEPFIALDLAMSVEDADGEVLGPAGSVKEALCLLENRKVAAAILDVHLSDGDVSPLAERLLLNGVHVILQTGVGAPPELAARFPNLIVHRKPMMSESLVQQLALLVASRGTAA